MLRTSILLLAIILILTAAVLAGALLTNPARRQAILQNVEHVADVDRPSCQHIVRAYLRGVTVDCDVE